MSEERVNFSLDLDISIFLIQTLFFVLPSSRKEGIYSFLGHLANLMESRVRGEVKKLVTGSSPTGALRKSQRGVGHGEDASIDFSLWSVNWLFFYQPSLLSPPIPALPSWYPLSSPTRPWAPLSNVPLQEWMVERPKEPSIVAHSCHPYIQELRQEESECGL